MFINHSPTSLSNQALYRIEIYGENLQVFSNKPVTSYENAVLVVQVNMFATLVWISVVSFYAPRSCSHGIFT